MKLRTAQLRAVAGIAALAACALALSPQPKPLRLDLLEQAQRAAPLVSRTALILLAFAVGAGLFGYLALFVAALLDKDERRMAARLRWAPRARRALATTLFLCILFTFYPRILGLFSRSLPPAPPPVELAGPPRSGGVVEGDSAGLRPEVKPPASPWLFGAGALGALAVAAALLLLGMLRLRRAGANEPAPEGAEAGEELRVEAARRRLELGDEARDAIVACYAEMCDIFSPQAASAPQGQSFLTAREFAALLGAKGVGAPEIAALTAVFEKARYSDEDCGETERQEALGALAAILRRYGEAGT